MQKLIGIVIIVIAIWVGIEVYTQGIDGAFGGVFASLSSNETQPDQNSAQQTPTENRTVPRRVGDRVQEHLDQGAARIDEQAEKE